VTADRTTGSFVGRSPPLELIAELADTLDALIDRQLAGIPLFGDDPPVVDRYLVERRLGVGATSVVYAAHDTMLGRPVALKIVAGRDVAGTWRERARAEARALARLAHPNVVAVYDVGEWRGHPFIAMELVAGQTLARWQAEQPRAWPAILQHYLAAARGLEAAHSVGLVHRDFKPANVLVADSGRVVVTDFGLAIAAEPDAGREPTSTGGGAGTPAYIAPEQREGAPPLPSADVYSFSVALCEALIGAHPDLAAPADWRRIPRRARPTLVRGMARDVAQRWAQMAPLIAALEACLPPSPPSGRRLRRASLALVLLAGLAGDRTDPRPSLPRPAAPQLAALAAPPPTVPAAPPPAVSAAPAAPPSATPAASPPPAPRQAIAPFEDAEEANRARRLQALAEAVQVVRGGAPDGAGRAGAAWAGDAQMFISAADVSVATGDLADARQILEQTARLLARTGARCPNLDYSYAQLYDKQAARTDEPAARLELMQQAAAAYLKFARSGVGPRVQRARARAAELAEELQDLAPR
jgi:serine/threonine protein kinase